MACDSPTPQLLCKSTGPDSDGQAALKSSGLREHRLSGGQSGVVCLCPQGELAAHQRTGVGKQEAGNGGNQDAPEMTEVEPVLDFASSERSGRRNALPDVLGSPAGVGPSDLPLKLGELSLTGMGLERPSLPQQKSPPPPQTAQKGRTMDHKGLTGKGTHGEDWGVRRQRDGLLKGMKTFTGQCHHWESRTGSH
ncbi:hypothetical protein JZ751_000380 [Albula glossodonta]|uniref:Uncharacterized protein n=1 Tax=Albula glossodonta TaxID=121402 RepID=A0A8T2PVM0_9TELE|nr:hypothetical protein JZ751_000380 [Albula glossodonta]